MRGHGSGLPDAEFAVRARHGSAMNSARDLEPKARGATNICWKR